MNPLTRPNNRAFPATDEGTGLSKREYFAALIMSNRVGYNIQKIGDDMHSDFVRDAEQSVLAADKLINALNKTDQ